MSKFIRPNYDDILLFPPCVDDLIPSDHEVRFVRDFVRELDLEQLGISLQPSRVGRPQYHPELLLTVWLYGYMNRIRSSRKLEKACRNQIDFIWLTGFLHPDHNTLSNFLKDNQKIFKKIFKLIIQTAKDLDLIKMILHALDGTKIASVISSKGALHRERLEKLLANIDKVIDEMVSSTVQTDQDDDKDAAQTALSAELSEAETRREKIRESLQKLNECNVNHLNPKEPDAQIMKMHAGKNQFGYNCQAIRDADSGMVVAEDVITDTTDYSSLTTVIDQVKDTFNEVAEVTVADNGYLSGEELADAELKSYNVLVNVDSYIKEMDKSENDFYPKSDFIYDETGDYYTCPEGKKLVFEATKKKTIKRKLSKKEYIWSVYRCYDCSGCPVFSSCTKGKIGRRINRSSHAKHFEDQIKLQKDEKNKENLKKRNVIIEPLFALFKEINGFRRFMYRNLSGAQFQWTMICTCHNIKTLYKLWTKGGFSLIHFGSSLRKMLQNG